MRRPKDFPAHAANERFVPFPATEHSDEELALIPRLENYKRGDLAFRYYNLVWELAEVEV